MTDGPGSRDDDDAAQGPLDDPNLIDAVSAAAKRSSLAKVAPGEAPSGSALLAAMGGVRGLIESILPGFAFLVIFAITGALVPSVVAPIAIAAIFVIIRLVARQPYVSALAGVIGIGLSAGLALFTGQAKDNFVFGFLINGAFLIALLISLAARWPLIGVIASLITSEGTSWRSDKAKVRVATIATVLWSGLFALRLAVELPLYFANNTTALAALKLLLGVPLYAAMLWVTWLLVRAAWTRRKDAVEPD